MTTSDNQSQCCPEFHPSSWDNKEVIWDNKLFITDQVKQVFHIPLNMGTVITRMWNMIQKADAAPKAEDFLMLAYDPSPWKSELYIAVTKSVPGMKMARLSGTFLSKVFDGPYNAVPKWIKEMDMYVKKKGRKILKYYFYYTTCPRCAKKYGHNYVVAFAQVA